MGLVSIMARQFRHPKGWLGQLVGRIMNQGNDRMNRLALEKLRVQPSDSILEIGFGNGKYINELASQTECKAIAGLDPSEAMIKSAEKKNRRHIKEGRVELVQGASEHIPFEASRFSKVFTVNTIYFWSDPLVDLGEIHRVLQPGGSLVLAFRSKERMQSIPMTQHDFQLFDPPDVERIVQAAGFAVVEHVSIQDGSLDAHCIVASKGLSEGAL